MMVRITGNNRNNLSTELGGFEHPGPFPDLSIIWVAVKELNLSYCIGGTILFTIYTHYGNLS